MSTATPRRMLIYQIQKRLSELSPSQLMTVASSIDDDGETRSVDDLSEPELYDLIVDYVRSEKLRILEDEGMAQLLLLDDMLSDVLATDAGEVEASQTTPLRTGAVMTHQQGCSTPPPSDYNHPDHPPATPTTDIPTRPSNMNSDSQTLPPSPQDQDVRPAAENRDTHSLPSPAGRSSSMPPRNLVSTASTKSLTVGAGGAPLGRVSPSSSVGDQAEMMSSQDKKEVVAVLHVKWSGVDRPLKMELQVILQRWLIRNAVGAACTVLSTSTDGRVVVKITPARALCELLKLKGRTQTINDDTTVTLISVSLTKTELETQRPDDASLDLPPSLWSEPHVEGQLGKQRGDMFSCTCDIPMHHFWYVNQAYKEEIKHIEKESGVKIMAEVKLTFEARQKDASPNNAFSEFINLVQKCSGEARGFTVPLKKMNPEEWKDTLNIIQRPENKLVLTLSSEEVTVCGPRKSQDVIRKSLNKEMTVCGPRQSQDAIRRSLNARTSISTSVGESTRASQDTVSTRASQDTLPSIGMSIKDPLVNAGLTMEENHWRMMTTSHNVQNKEEVQVTLSVIWSGGAQPQKSKAKLDKVLQSWINNNDKFNGDCKVLNVSEDGSAVISLTPPPALTELQTLSGQSLSTKDGKTVKIKSVSLTPSDQKIKTPASMKHPPSMSDQVQPGQQGGAVSAAGQETCTVPVGHFWYVNHIFKEEIQRIEKDLGVKITAEVNVTFQADRKDGSPQEALSEFTTLVQNCLGDSEGSAIPLKNVGQEGWKDALKLAQTKESKVLLTLSSEDMTVCGPRQNQNVIRKLLVTRASTSVGESTWAPQDTLPNIGMSIKDPLVNAGLTMEENHWKLMTTSYNKQVDKIKTKFGVEFKESGTSQGKVEVKACHKRSGGNASMESHAVRALLHLYQRTATSPYSFTQPLGAAGFTSSQSEGASGGPVLNGQSEHKTEAPTGGGATAGDGEEDKCPICMETFTKKTQLKCKHEYCEECLAQSEKSMGPICPVCREVFGMMEGDQPDGEMRWCTYSYPLPGFPGCGTITIDYYISGGTQTEKHPNPGKHYSGIHRTAYLPDNKEGTEVLRLLKKAFDQKLIFTIGTSRTTGIENQVTWNDIHHKTNISGGPQGFGYPDPDYLSRVKEELKAKGIE